MCCVVAEDFDNVIGNEYVTLFQVPSSIYKYGGLTFLFKNWILFQHLFQPIQLTTWILNWF